MMPHPARKRCSGLPGVRAAEFLTNAAKRVAVSSNQPEFAARGGAGRVAKAANSVVTAFPMAQRPSQYIPRRRNSRPCSPVFVFCSPRSCCRCRSWSSGLARRRCCAPLTRNLPATLRGSAAPEPVFAQPASTDAPGLKPVLALLRVDDRLSRRARRNRRPTSRSGAAGDRTGRTSRDHRNRPQSAPEARRAAGGGIIATGRPKEARPRRDAGSLGATVRRRRNRCARCRTSPAPRSSRRRSRCAAATVESQAAPDAAPDSLLNKPRPTAEAAPAAPELLRPASAPSRTQHSTKIATLGGPPVTIEHRPPMAQNPTMRSVDQKAPARRAKPGAAGASCAARSDNDAADPFGSDRRRHPRAEPTPQPARSDLPG